MTESVATSQMATLPSTSSYSNLITAEIRVENLSATPVEQSISIPTSSQQTADVVSDEPEKKRQKLDNSPLKAKKLEKLENRLGGILCCAVCLDLPRAAMYQVSFFFQLRFAVLESLIRNFLMLVEGKKLTLG